MDTSKVMDFLRESLKEISSLAKLPYDNHDYPLWYSTIEGVLEKAFGQDSREYVNFHDAFQQASFSGQDNQQEYRKELKMRETSLLSIIRTNEIVGIEAKVDSVTESPKVFISHGKGGGALLKLEKFLRELGVVPIIVKDQPSSDRTVDTKVQDYLNEADFVIIFATGDDVIKGKGKDIKQPRQNVIHEIGLAQKTHPGKIIYLLEEGAEFPSNIKPKVYESFARQSLDEAFTAIVRELRNWGYLKVGKI